MVKLSFKSLQFSEKEDKIRVIFLEYNYFYINRKSLENMGKIKVERNSIEFITNKKKENIENKFNFILSEGFSKLKNTLNGKPVLYIHQNSGIPLIGSGEFGIVDRGTNMIEVKPMTYCNVNCVFCSVDHDKRKRDIVIEKDYLIQELRKIIDVKDKRVNIHIGGQGDPSLYGDLVGLIKDMKKIDQINTISMVTNAVILTKSEVQRLIDVGLSHFHISLCAIDQDLADRIAQTKYPVKKVMELCEMIAASDKSKLILAPVMVPGLNEEEIEKIIQYGKKIGALIGVQNFLEYQFGKKPVKNSIPMKVFMERIDRLEEKYDIDLKGLDGDLKIEEDVEIPRIFKKGDVIEVETVWDGRLKNTKIAIAKDKIVNVISCHKDGRFKVKLIRTKHNIYTAAPV